MKKVLLTVTGFIVVAMLFTGVGYATATWLNFEGDEQITQSDGHVEEIMKILRQVNDGKITAEEAELRLEGEVSQLNKDKDSLQDDIEYLEGLLEDIAGETPGQKINKLKEANENLRNQNTQLGIDLQNEKDNNQELQTSIAGLQEDNERLQGTIGLRDNEIIGLKNDVADLEEQLANAPEDQTEYVAHLEAELEKANNAVEQHNTTTQKAVEEARTYK